MAVPWCLALALALTSRINPSHYNDRFISHCPLILLYYVAKYKKFSAVKIVLQNSPTTNSQRRAGKNHRSHVGLPGTRYVSKWRSMRELFLPSKDVKSNFLLFPTMTLPKNLSNLCRKFIIFLLANYLSQMSPFNLSNYVPRYDET
jgi:hypothetical protein